MMKTPEDVLRFWFGPGERSHAPPPELQRYWWMKNAEFDATIRDDFGDLHDHLSQGEDAHWTSTATGRLAHVIVLDQFSRNMFRGSPKSFVQDPLAREIALAGFNNGHEQQLTHIERYFLYMPLMHSEDLGQQELSVSKFTALAETAAASGESLYASAIDFARQHRDIVARFGRFPHRNEILGRQSTPEERAFLLEPNSSF